MSIRALTKPQNTISSSFVPVFGKKRKGQDSAQHSANYNEINTIPTPQVGHNFGSVSVNNTQSLSQSCPLSLSTPSRCPFGGVCHTCPPRIQAKLKIGQPNDKYEQEADRVADEIMRMPDPQVQKKSCSSCNENGEEKLIQTKSLSGQISPLVQRQPIAEEEEEELIQTKIAGEVTPDITPAISSSIQSFKGGGRPLSQAERSYFEPRFGRDFRGVRLHTSSTGTDAARRLQAKAFTIGNDIVFGRGGYQLTSKEGWQLLAHELAHVVQQNNDTTTIQLQPNPKDEQHIVQGGGATSGKGVGKDVTFIFKTPYDIFTNEVIQYMENTLQHQEIIKVASIDDIFEYLQKMRGHKPSLWGKAGGEKETKTQKIRRIRIVSHGSVAGGVKMGYPNYEFINPAQVREYISKGQNAIIVAEVMARDAVVEFWGCNIGQSKKTGEAWSELFRSDFKATAHTMRTGENEFYRPAERRSDGTMEEGRTIEGNQGSWVKVTRSAEVDKRNINLQRDFRRWLLKQYDHLVANGDIKQIPNEDERIPYMRNLFDRSQGSIRHILIEENETERTVRPGDREAWAQLWKTFEYKTIWEKARSVAK